MALAGWMALVARSPRGWRAAGVGWAFGFGHFAIGLNWIATAFTYHAAMPAWLRWIAVVLLSLYLAVYPALAAWGARMGKPRGEQPVASPSYLLAFEPLWLHPQRLPTCLFHCLSWSHPGLT